MKRATEVNQEFIICRYLNGITLLPREYFTSDRNRYLCVKPIKPVADIMQMPFNVFFHSADFETKEINEHCLHSCGFSSKVDAVGYSVARFATDQIQSKRIYQNHKHVMAATQLAVFDESVVLRDGRNIQGVSFKMPWYDKNDFVIGVFGCAVIIYPDSLNSIAGHLAAISAMFLQSQVPAKNLLPGREINGEYFSPREVDVMQGVMQGKTMREIGLLLGLKTRTVEFYFSNIKEKVGVKTKSQLIERVMVEAEKRCPFWRNDYAS